MTTREATSLLARTDLDWPEDVRRGMAEKLHVIAFALIQWPWLLRSLSGGSAAERARLLARLSLRHDALPNLGSWKADAGFLNLLVDHVERARPAQVVELGAGATSLVLGRALQLNGDGRLTSCDQHGDFVAETRKWLADHGIHSDLRTTPLVRAPHGWPGIWYDTAMLPSRIDMLVIDGPPWTIHPQVRGAAETLFDRLPIGGCVMLDDAARPGERIVAKRWRQRWPGFDFKLVHGGTKGTLIGTRLR